MDKINSHKLKFEKLIKELNGKGLIKTYDEFLKTEEAKEYALTEEVHYYTSKYLESKKAK